MIWFALIAAALFSACSENEKLLSLRLGDTDGKEFVFTEIKNYRAAVFVFFSPQCPLSENYSRTVNSLARKFRSDSLLFLCVFPGNYYSPQEINDFKRVYIPGLRALLDPEFELTPILHATVTPQAVIVAPQGDIKYSGAIDDWAYEPGATRQVISRHYLEDALQSVLAGKPVAIPETEPIGCIIEYDSH